MGTVTGSNSAADVLVVMRKIHVVETLDVPEDVKVTVKRRLVTVTGKRGTLARSFRHDRYDMFMDKNGRRLRVEAWFAKQADCATCKTITTHVSNMIKGVSVGFKYKMRFAYAHFPINVTITDDKVVEIRNFLGEKFVRRVTVRPGVGIERTDPTKVKDEIVLTGNNLEEVSRSAADIHQSILVRAKDIRKFLDGIYVSAKEAVDVEV
eukprot:NODE_2953_length_721_cov_6175.002976_g1930_i7.p2 GENE.NODE_2953_length_721_cov_6175.002976_g1930_i7~~NODE_2953_length_721_cov_6175.002976_g1930_i7.p2  ORF type:complete len:208 (-),score=52.01 NODE_2953_length_721_cov_6175.002976_g1930_i7:70-693(-)